MTRQIEDLLVSLTAMMDEETAALGRRGPRPDLAALSEAKQRLTATLEQMTAQRLREDAAWMANLPEEERARLMALIAPFRDACAANAAVLQRQIQLSQDILAAVAGEAERLSGTRHKVYGAAGNLSRAQLPTPLSVNSRI